MKKTTDVTAATTAAAAVKTPAAANGGSKGLPPKASGPSKLDFYDEEFVEQAGFARVLLVGPPKVGKSVAVGTTAPGPVVILNCDQGEALVPVRRHGGKFKALNIDSALTWSRATKELPAMAERGECRTCVVDTVTLLAGNTLEREMASKYTGFDVYSHMEDALMSGLNRLANAPMHLFVIAHMTKDEAVGVLPDIPGKAKRLITGLLSDWILLSYDPKRTDMERAFVLGPYEGWRGHGRNIKRTALIPADVGVLLDELGIAR